jgi:hypothetical protein
MCKKLNHTNGLSALISYLSEHFMILEPFYLPEEMRNYNGIAIDLADVHVILEIT